MPKNRVKTIDRAMDLLEYFRDHEEAGVIELAENMDVAKSSVHNYLVTLTERGYLRQNEDGKYELTLKFLGLGGLGRQRLRIHGPMRALLEEISETTGQSVSFATEVDGELMFIDLVRGEKAVETDVHVGWSTKIHTLPEGKLILAHSPKAHRKDLLDRIRDSSTALDAEEIEAELEKLRMEEEFVTSHGNIVDGVTTISRPVFTNQDTFHGIVMIATPTEAINPERIETYSGLLRQKLARFKVNVSFTRS